MNDTELFDAAWAMVEDEGFCDGFGGAEYRRVMGEYAEALRQDARPTSLCLFIMDRCNDIPGKMPWDQIARRERKGEALDVAVGDDGPDDFAQDDGKTLVEEVVHETAKALLMRIDGQEHWVPKKVILCELPRKGDLDVRIILPDWIVEKIFLKKSKNSIDSNRTI